MGPYLSDVSGGSTGGREIKLLANYNSNILRVLMVPQEEDLNILWPLSEKQTMRLIHDFSLFALWDSCSSGDSDVQLETGAGFLAMPITDGALGFIHRGRGSLFCLYNFIKGLV